MISHLRNLEEKCIVFAGRICPPALPYLRRYQRLLRYLVSGGTAAAVDLLFLYLLTDVLHMHYLAAAVLAFLIAFAVSFLLQKFWTFEDDSLHNVRAQAVMYFVVAAANLGVNTLLMYAFVEWAHLWYMLAQFLASGLIAFESFFVSRYVIFKKHGSDTDQERGTETESI